MQLHHGEREINKANLRVLAAISALETFSIWEREKRTGAANIWIAFDFDWCTVQHEKKTAVNANEITLEFFPDN